MLRYLQNLIDVIFKIISRVAKLDKGASYNKMAAKLCKIYRDSTAGFYTMIIVNKKIGTFCQRRKRGVKLLEILIEVTVSGKKLAFII